MYLLILFLSIQIALAAPNDYPCKNESPDKEKIIVIGACSDKMCSVKTQNVNNKVTKRMISIEDAFVGDEVEVLKPKCSPTGYELYAEHAKKIGKPVLSPSEWEARKEANLKKYSNKERRFFVKMSPEAQAVEE